MSEGERIAISFAGRRFEVDQAEDRIYELGDVHACGYYERALASEVERLREALEPLLEPGAGWGDDAADEWWQDKLRAALHPTEERK